MKLKQILSILIVTITFACVFILLLSNLDSDNIVNFSTNNNVSSIRINS